jgi:hypothetical protein
MTATIAPNQSIVGKEPKISTGNKQKQKTIRLTLDVTEDFDTVLVELAEKRHASKSDILRTAVAYYAYLSQSVGKDRKLSVTDMNDKVIKDIVLI